MDQMALGLVSTAAAALCGLNVVQRRALYAARHDPLTGLASRHLWTAHAEHAARQPHGLVVVLVDGDGVKRTNDRFGHEAGDALINALARRLEDWTDRRGEACRLGGDELVAYVRLPRSLRLSEQLDVLSGELSAPVQYRQTWLPASASVGAAVVGDMPQPTLHRAMRAADEAMYQAKRAGGGAWRLAEDCAERTAVNVRCDAI